IAAAIAKTHRGVTVLNGQGWYTKKEQKVLIVLAKKRESTNIFRIIKGIDPNAFVSQSKVIGVFGEGFDKIKAK
ncbi:MAG: YitT family protein, partial [Bacteroidaceae bacterium]